MTRKAQPDLTPDEHYLTIYPDINQISSECDICPHYDLEYDYSKHLIQRAICRPSRITATTLKPSLPILVTSKKS